MQPTTQPPSPGNWFLYLPGQIIDRVAARHSEADGERIEAEGGHSFWWKPEHFVVLMASEVEAYSDVTRALTNICATFLSSCTRGGMAAPMSTVLLRSSLRAVMVSLGTEVEATE